MNRRGFLGSLAAAAAALTLDPEMLLWKPGAKTIFIPSPSLDMALTLEEINRITMKYFVPEIRRQVFEVPEFWLRPNGVIMANNRVFGSDYSETHRENRSLSWD